MKSSSSLTVSCSQWQHIRDNYILSRVSQSAELADKKHNIYCLQSVLHSVRGGRQAALCRPVQMFHQQQAISAVQTVLSISATKLHLFTVADWQRLPPMNSAYLTATTKTTLLSTLTNGRQYSTEAYTYKVRE